MKSPSCVAVITEQKKTVRSVLSVCQLHNGNIAVTAEQSNELTIAEITLDKFREFLASMETFADTLESFPQEAASISSSIVQM